jgi:redox-sensitive bicupin YhaK (pirin superfamily)
MNVRPHPHIGLATVTWLFEGSIYHRDSLGSTQPIAPGELNWMTAGRGIVHSERTSPAELARQRQMFGIQSWVALPKAAEDQAPGFHHYATADLPVIADNGVSVRLIAGSLYGETAPVKTASELYYAEARLEAAAQMPLPALHEERGVYVCEGAVEIAGERFEAGRLLVFRPGEEITIKAPVAARLQLLGGEPMDGPRHIWWNFVSSSKERIEQAKAEWRSGRFDIVPGDAEEFIPLPE